MKKLFIKQITKEKWVDGLSFTHTHGEIRSWVIGAIIFVTFLVLMLVGLPL